MEQSRRGMDRKKDVSCGIVVLFDVATKAQTIPKQVASSSKEGHRPSYR